MGGLANAFSRLSQREKILIVTMVVLLVGSVIVITNLWFGSRVATLEEQISDDRTALRQIYDKAGKFIDSRNQDAELKQAAAENEALNLKLAVNELAKRISFNAKDRRGEPAGSKKLADVMTFEQTQEVYLSKKKKKRRRGRDKDKKESDDGFYRRDQPITLSDNVPFKAVYDLLEKLETSKEMLFVTDIDLTRDFQDGGLARKNAKVIVSTYYYKGVDE